MLAGRGPWSPAPAWLGSVVPPLARPSRKRPVRAVDDEPVVPGPLGEVALVPDTVDALVVGGLISGVVGVVVEAERHRRECVAAYQFSPALGPQRVAEFVDHVDVEAQRGALDLPGVNRAGRITGHETTAQVGAARNRSKMKVGLDSLIDGAEPLRCQSRARGGHCAQAREVMRVDGSKTGLAERLNELCGGSEECGLCGVGQVEEPVSVGEHRSAVVEHQGRSGGQAGDLPVPHHPSGGGVVEDAVAVLDVAVQLMFDQVFQQDPAGSMDDALGSAGGARREQHIPGVVESETCEGRLGRRGLVDEVFQRDRLGETSGTAVAQVGDNDDLLH